MCILCIVISHCTGAFKGKFFNVGLLHKVALVENKNIICNPKHCNTSVFWISVLITLRSCNEDQIRQEHALQEHKILVPLCWSAGMKIWATIWWFLTKNISGILSLFTSTKKTTKKSHKNETFFICEKSNSQQKLRTIPMMPHSVIYSGNAL